MKVKEKTAKVIKKITKYLKWPFLILCIVSALVVGQLTYLVAKDKVKAFNYFKARSAVTDSLSLKLIEYEEKRIRLFEMTKAMRIAYNVSEWEAKYYSVVFDDFAQKHEVPWEVFPAVMRIESNFRTTLKSKAGARGLMQVLDGTAREVAGKIGINYNSETLWNDLLNLVIGMTYLTDGILSEVDTSGVQEKDIRHGFQIYLGGPDYKKTIKSNEANGTYLINYKSTVWEEYHKLTYIYKGVQSEREEIECCGGM